MARVKAAVEEKKKRAEEKRKLDMTRQVLVIAHRDAAT